jgi:hypothetical protein
VFHEGFSVSCERGIVVFTFVNSSQSQGDNLTELLGAGYAKTSTIVNVFFALTYRCFKATIRQLRLVVTFVGMLAN